MSVIIRLAGASALTALALVSTMVPAGAGTAVAAPAGHLVLVQALPQHSLDVAIDGRTVDHDSTTGAVLGPFAVSPGPHQVAFTGTGGVHLVSTVEVADGDSKDVVIHLPAQVDGAPVVNSYRTPLAPIAPGKARVLLAHTATVAPADVRVDGTVVFRDIANGEYATADVAAGAHTVALLPAGLSHPPILGPLQLSLKPGTVTMVYAVGNPRTHSMNVILHSAALTSNGATTLEGIDTGSAGLAGNVRVHPFAVGHRPAPSPGPGHATQPWLMVLVLMGVGGGLLARWRTRRRPLGSR